MDDLTQRYYEAEMRYLREAGKEFAQAYPDRAAMLNLDKPGARDPYVERLFEGFAFLMGRLREKLDDDLPELTEGLVSLLWPHYLRTIPSLSVVELTTDHQQMKQSDTLKEFQVLSRPIGERRTRCVYSATRDITLHPLALPDVSLQYEPDGRSVIRLRFECGPLVGDWSQIDLSRLPLYLNADSPVACALHRALTLGIQQFWLRLPGQERRVLDAHFSPMGFDDDDRLWPKGESAFSGYQLLLEYFTFREKFMFVALNGLENVIWPERITGFEIDVVLAETGLMICRLIPTISACTACRSSTCSRSKPIRYTFRRWKTNFCCARCAFRTGIPRFIPSTTLFLRAIPAVRRMSPSPAFVTGAGCCATMRRNAITTRG